MQSTMETLSTMEVVLVLSLMVLSASAVPPVDVNAVNELPEYSDVADAYGKTLSFQITTDTYYPASWQRVNGDPHGQVAEEEKPDPLGDETLSFDFPDTGTHSLLLWHHPTHDVDIIGTADYDRLHSLYVDHPLFNVSFSDTAIVAHTDTLTETYGYLDTFDFLMNAGLGARVRSVDVYPPSYRTIELLFGGYLFRVIAPEGVYNVSGQIELGMSVTLWEGEHLEFEGLMGQIDGYTIYSEDDPERGDYALAVPLIEGVEKDPVLVRRNHHLGAYKTCWHYNHVDKSKSHGIIGDFQDFLYP